MRRGKKTGIKVSDVKLIPNSTIIMTNSTRQVKSLKEISDSLNVKKKVFKGSTVLRICMVASGEADIFISHFTNICKWDTCAGQVILEEAGGLITDLDGNPLNYKQDKPNWKNAFIASNKALHKSVLDKIKELSKPKSN